MALIGQSLFGQEVYSHLCKEGHRVVGVFTVPDKDGKADPLGECILEQLDHGLCTWPSRAKSICMVDTDSNILPSLVGLKTKMQAPVVLSFSTYQCGNHQVHQRNFKAYVFPELRL